MVLIFFVDMEFSGDQLLLLVDTTASLREQRRQAAIAAERAEGQLVEQDSEEEENESSSLCLEEFMELLVRVSSERFCLDSRPHSRNREPLPLCYLLHCLVDEHLLAFNEEVLDDMDQSELSFDYTDKTRERERRIGDSVSIMLGSKANSVRDRLASRRVNDDLTANFYHTVGVCEETQQAFKKQVASPEVNDVLERFSPFLSEIFVRYSKKSPTKLVHSKNDRFVSGRAFESLLLASGFIDREDVRKQGKKSRAQRSDRTSVLRSYGPGNGLGGSGKISQSELVHVFCNLSCVILPGSEMAPYGNEEFFESKRKATAAKAVVSAAPLLLAGITKFGQRRQRTENHSAPLLDISTDVALGYGLFTEAIVAVSCYIYPSPFVTVQDRLALCLSAMRLSLSE